MNFTLRISACAGLLAATAPAALAAATPHEIILHDFAGPEGAHPLGGVIVDSPPIVGGSQSRVLGTAYSGGANGEGTVFAIDSGSLTVLHSFHGGEGKFPQAGLTAGPDGVLYGTLSNGGDRTVSRDGSGAVFALRPDGKYTTLHLFHGPEGSQPLAPVTLDGAGNILGTTQGGGVRHSYSGTVFKITPDGTTTALVDFSRTSCQGPHAPVSLDASGNLFGTTWMNADSAQGCVWEYTAAGTYSLLHRFTNSIAGREPRGGVVVAGDGTLYGTAYYSGGSGPGDIYKIAADGTATTLHHFGCGSDGGYPDGSLLMDSHGVLYGLAASCGTGGGGVLFSYDTVHNVFAVVYPFKNNQRDGYLPIGPVSMDATGNLYGTTEYGGVNNLGIVFEIKR